MSYGHSYLNLAVVLNQENASPWKEMARLPEFTHRWYRRWSGGLIIFASDHEGGPVIGFRLYPDKK